MDNTDYFYGLDASVIRYLIKETHLSNDSQMLEINCGIACHALPLFGSQGGKIYLGLNPVSTQCCVG